MTEEGDRLTEWLREDPRLHPDELRDEMAETLNISREELDARIEHDARAWREADADLVYVLGLDLGPAEFDENGQPVARREMPAPADG